MSTIVTVKNTNQAGGDAVKVITERIIEGGRQRLENGESSVAPGIEQTFVLHAEQSLRIVEEQA